MVRQAHVPENGHCFITVQAPQSVLAGPEGSFPDFFRQCRVMRRGAAAVAAMAARSRRKSMLYDRHSPMAKACLDLGQGLVRLLFAAIQIFVLM